MVCSAPEMTTVSNPNRNPARADVIDHRRIRTFIESRTKLFETLSKKQIDPRLLETQSITRQRIALESSRRLPMSRRGMGSLQAELTLVHRQSMDVRNRRYKGCGR